MQNLSQISAVLFDMDGVILDSEVAACVVWKNICAEFALELTDEFFLTLVGVGLKDTGEKLRNHFGEKFIFEEALFYREKHWDKYLRENPLPIKKGFTELAAFLKKNNILYGIVSSTERVQVEKRLKSAGVEQEQFSTIVCGDEVINRKPLPEPYLKAATLLNIEPKNCIVIEDSEHGANAGISAGMNVIIVPDLLTPSKEISMQVKAVLNNLKEVEQYLEELEND